MFSLKKKYLFTWLHQVLVVCGIQALSWGMWNLVPWPGIEPGPLHWKQGVLAMGPPGKSLTSLLKWGNNTSLLANSSLAENLITPNGSFMPIQV